MGKGYLSWPACLFEIKILNVSNQFLIYLCSNSVMQIFSQYLKCKKDSVSPEKYLPTPCLPSTYHTLDADCFLLDPIFSWWSFICYTIFSIISLYSVSLPINLPIQISMKHESNGTRNFRLNKVKFSWAHCLIPIKPSLIQFIYWACGPGLNFMVILNHVCHQQCLLQSRFIHLYRV